jgi:hypothetical protein
MSGRSDLTSLDLSLDVVIFSLAKWVCQVEFVSQRLEKVREQRKIGGRLSTRRDHLQIVNRVHGGPFWKRHSVLVPISGRHISFVRRWSRRSQFVNEQSVVQSALEVI